MKAAAVASGASVPAETEAPVGAAPAAAAQMAADLAAVDLAAVDLAAAAQMAADLAAVDLAQAQVAVAADLAQVPVQAQVAVAADLAQVPVQAQVPVVERERARAALARPIDGAENESSGLATASVETVGGRIRGRRRHPLPVSRNALTGAYGRSYCFLDERVRALQERTMPRFRGHQNLQTFIAIAIAIARTIYNHFNQKRHLYSRQDFKEN